VFLHDQSGCIYVGATNLTDELTPGKIIEAEGWTELGV
jgi:hypothetical protein